MRRATTLLALALAACAPATADPFPDIPLDGFSVDVLPDLSALSAVTERPDAPFVMINLLAFRAMAVGEDFEGLTGAEAYALYAEGVQDAQQALGSRLIWTGVDAAHVVGVSDPSFQAFALAEYASPASFLAFSVDPGDNPDARSAGLLGQWLIPSTTLEEGDPSAITPASARPDDADLARSGLDDAQRARLSALSNVAPVFVVELLRFEDETGEAAAPWRDAWRSAITDQGGTVLWRGTMEKWVLGTAEPAFHELQVSAFPSAQAVGAALADGSVVDASDARTEGLANHWLYLTASDDGFTF